MTINKAVPPQEPTTIDAIEFGAMALDDTELETLAGRRGECVFNWSTREGDPVGVVVAYVYRDRTFWTNCAARKSRVAALRNRPQSALVLNTGGRSATFKGTSRIHTCDEDDWAELTRWFYPALAGVDPDADDPSSRAMLRFLDSPHQVIIETPADLLVSFDYGKFNAAVQAALQTHPG